MSMDFKKKLPIPMKVKEQYPVNGKARAAKEKIDNEAKSIITGASDKKLLIIGPCSADREDSVFEYCERLSLLQQEVCDKLLIIARVFTNKPRTAATGYKGMIFQPDANEKPDPFKGITAIRRLHTHILTQLGLSTADEVLYPANYRYVSDLMSYVTIGARSVENQEHRLVASGIDIPVGMKNPTGGNLDVMLNAVTAARFSHEFIYRGWDMVTSGNPYSHAVLRGYVTASGKHVQNCKYDDLSGLCNLFSEREITNPAVIVDTNHSNSGKNCFLQPEICMDVLLSCKKNSEIKKLVKGFMIESYLFDGSQKIGPDETAGISITDPCLGWQKSKDLVLRIADSI